MFEGTALGKLSVHMELMALLFTAPPHPTLPITMIMGALLVISAITDIRSFRILDIATIPSALAIALVRIIDNPLDGCGAIGQAAAIFALLYVFARLARRGLGMGDVKLMAVCALSLPLFAWLLAEVIALLACLTWTVTWHAIRWRMSPAPDDSLSSRIRTARIALAPFIGIGYLAVQAVRLVIGGT